ncbi:MAG: 16S rRNA (uracil(1498)-N(3))-methyltransferase [Nocardioides sp.]|jgi:16S rRNA (uracil1498-N3)-methyltransferase
MSLPVHVVPSLDGIGREVIVEGDEAHHAVVVRRLKVGERLILTDGCGSSVAGAVTQTAKRSFTVAVEEVRHTPEPSPRITVVQALPKGERGELAVEVLTEIGVARILPWAAARSVAVWRGERAAKSHAKWAATAREAAKQARRVWHPEVLPLADTADVLTLIRGAEASVILHEEATESLLSAVSNDAVDLVIVVGPEGGLTDEEVALFEAAGARSVRLGAEVLRTSTAGVAAAAAVLSRGPRWT